MYESECLKSLATMPMMRMRCSGELDGSWLPLKQDWSTRWCTLPELYKQMCAKRIHNFETRESDVFVVTFMKSGTTWMQELAWLLLNQLDFERAKSCYLPKRSRFIEFMRRGIVGSYKDELSAVAKEKMDKWTKDSLKDYGITESDIFGEI
ncbi:GH23311 [Drosophila grimshawi]|uniref:GH23311 n=1 Tax=Drosophila grimshawi TaxID=7222 RepID=B4JZZ1_DROGR|nr:GH23311 [Drosophila grimshawi]